MKIHIAIITSDFLKEYTEDILKNADIHADVSIYTYKSISELETIYLNIPKYIQSCIVAGSMAAQFLRLRFPDSSMKFKEFNNDDLGLYKLFLNLLVKHRDLDLKRVYADIIDISNLDLEQYLLNPYSETISDALYQSSKNYSIDELLNLEQGLLQKHLDKWNNGETDISITRISSIMKPLEQAGIPVYFAYPDPNYVKMIIQTTVQELTIHSQLDFMPGSCLVSLRTASAAALPDTSTEWLAAEQKIALKNALRDFCSLYNVDYLLQEELGGFMIVTHRKFITMATSDFQTCHLQNYLSDRFDGEISVGYGLGSSLYHARVNAINANREACKYPNSFSCLINDKDRLVDLLNRSGQTDKPIITLELSDVNDAILALAKTTGLSTLNIQKLISIMEPIPNGHITSQELSDKLHITRRSANRLLASLKAAGKAKVVGQKPTVNSGRPQYIYQLKLM